MEIFLKVKMRKFSEHQIEILKKFKSFQSIQLILLKSIIATIKNISPNNNYNTYITKDKNYIN